MHGGRTLNNEEITFMYDRDFEPLIYEIVHSMALYYRILTALFRHTLDPKSGDATSVLHNTKTLLSCMQDHPSKEKGFSVFQFIYSFIIENSIFASKSCGYAPFIMALIERTCGTELAHDKVYSPYRVQSIKILAVPSSRADSPVGATSTSTRSRFGNTQSSSKKSSLISRALRSIFNLFGKVCSSLKSFQSNGIFHSNGNDQFA